MDWDEVMVDDGGAGQFDEFVAGLSDSDLALLASSITSEQVRRGKEASAGQDGVSSFGEDYWSEVSRSEPFIQDGVVVLTGVKTPLSSTRHESRFFLVNEEWAWESEFMLGDEMSAVSGKNGIDGVQSITTVPVVEGLRIDCLWLKGSVGNLRVQRCMSWEVSDGEIMPVPARRKPGKANRSVSR